MQEEILDFEWVISHETKITIPSAKLLQKGINLDSLVLTCAMLSDNNIAYQIVEPEKNLPEQWSTVFEVHIPENEFEKANTLLDLLLNHDPKYPKRKFQGYSILQLEGFLDKHQNSYNEALAVIELRIRGYYEDGEHYENEISDFIQVYNYNNPEIKNDCDLFQKCANEAELIRNAAMLFDDKISYYIERNNPEEQSLLENYHSHNIFVKKANLTRANELYQWLNRGNKNYPYRKFQNLKDDELKELISGDSDDYRGALAALELNVRGHNIVEIKSNKRRTSIITVILIVIFLIAFLSFFINRNY